MKTQRYDIVLLPSDEVSQKAVVLSEELEGPDTFFTLRNGSFFPHLSLYMVDLSDESIEQAIRQLSAIATSFSPLELKAIGYRQHHGYIGVEYEKTDALVALQKAVLAQFSPLRDPAADAERANETESRIARENTIEYGYPSVGRLFEPHITITRFKDDAAIETDSLPPMDRFYATFGSLAIFEMGEHGTCIRKLAEYELTT